MGTDIDTTCVLCGLELDDDELQEGTGLGDQRRPCLPGRIHLLRLSIAAECIHCGRFIVNEGEPGLYTWIDPDATGDDGIWREVCEAHDTFTAEHEPDDRPQCRATGCTNRATLVDGRCDVHAELGLL